MFGAGLAINVIGVLLVVALTWWVGAAALGFSTDTGDAALPDWARRPDNVTKLCAALKYPCVI
jgi:hypothetical protein